MAEDNVQTYLTKHKVSSLFEDLMAKIVKELPPDPVEYLIRKLQVLQRQRKKDVPSVSPIKASRGRIQVTGTSVSKTSPNSKSPVSDRLSKSTSGLRPVKPKSSLTTSSVSSLSKTTPTKATPTRPVSSRPVTTSGGTRSTSKIPTASGIKPGKVASRPVSASTKQPVSTGKVSTTSRTPNSRTLTSGGKTTPGVKKTPSAVRTPSGKPAATTGRTVSSSSLSSPAQSMSQPAPKKKVPKAMTSPAHMHKDEAKEEEIGEFFGDPKKSSQKQFYADSDDESSDLGVESDGGSDDEGVGVAGHVTHSQALDIQLILANKRCKHTKRSKVKKAPPLHLVDAVADSSAALCLGYDEDTESGDSDVEVWEDGDTLRDEGVEVSRGTPIRKSVMAPSQQQEEVVVCARCAQALGRSNQVLLSGVEFESASQVGSHASYPQWGSEGGYDASERSQETSSDVTLESHDTWGGLAPPPQPQPLISDEESEVHLPPPSLHGHTWEAQTPPQENPHGWGQQTQ